MRTRVDEEATELLPLSAVCPSLEVVFLTAGRAKTVMAAAEAT